MCNADSLNKLGFAAMAARVFSDKLASVTELKSTISLNAELKSGSEAMADRWPATSASVIFP